MYLNKKIRCISVSSFIYHKKTRFLEFKKEIILKEDFILIVVKDEVKKALELDIDFLYKVRNGLAKKIEPIFHIEVTFLPFDRGNMYLFNVSHRDLFLI